MYYCPHCHKPTAMSSGPCPHCGKELSGRESKRNAVEEGELKPVDAHAVADGEAPLELAIEPLRARKIKKGKAPSAVASNLITEEKVGEEGAEGRTLQIEVDRQLERISGYGHPPDGWSGTVSYMWRVRKRRAVIRAMIAEMEKQKEAMESEVGGELLVIGKRKLKDQKIEEKYRPQVELINEAKKRLDELDREKSSEQREMEEKKSYLEEEVVRLQNEVGKLRVEEEVLGKQLREKTAEFSRARARFQRFDVEIRNLKQIITQKKRQVGETSTGSKEIMELEERIGEIEDEKQKFALTYEEAKVALDEVDRKLALLKSSITELMGKITAASKRKEVIVSSLKERSKQIEEKYLSARKSYENRVIELAKMMIEEDELPEEFASLKKRLEDKIGRLEKLEEKVSAHKSALDSYSTTAYQRGIIVLGAGAGLLVLFIILLIILLG